MYNEQSAAMAFPFPSPKRLDDEFVTPRCVQKPWLDDEVVIITRFVTAAQFVKKL